MRKTLAVAAILIMVPVVAMASYAYRDGNGTLRQIFSYLCQGTLICPAQVLIDSSGTEKATQANPLRVDPTGTTPQPVTASALPLPANAAQETGGNLASILAALQGTIVSKAPTVTWTRTAVTLSANSSGTLIAANSNRKALRWMVTGTNAMCAAPGASISSGQGFCYNGAAAAGFQGGSDDFVGEVSTQQFSALSALGTTVEVWQGQ